MSQAALAEAAHTYQSVVGRIEAGMTSPSLETLARLVSAAGFELKLSLEPALKADPVIDAYKPGIDQTLLIENLRRPIDERLRINTQLNAAFDDADRDRLKRSAERKQ